MTYNLLALQDSFRVRLVAKEIPQPRHRSSIERRVQHSCQLLLPVGLAQQRQAVQKLAYSVYPGLRKPRSQHDLQRRPAFPRQARQLTAVQASGHDDIGEQQADRFAPEHFEGSCGAIALKSEITNQSLRAPLTGVQARLNGRVRGLARAGEVRGWPMEFSTFGSYRLQERLPLWRWR